ncbi:MAG: hypothetical protein DWI22_11285 [Planctomycetota bacterium]|nr:MAG: hypothetical protein DWI22_11285 [Planctomycetota bacterium]
MPNRQSLKLNDKDAAHDLDADFDLTEVPTELKRVFYQRVLNPGPLFERQWRNQSRARRESVGNFGSRWNCTIATLLFPTYISWSLFEIVP